MLKTILVLFMSFMFMSAQSQNLHANLYYSTNPSNLVGGDVYGVLKSGVVVGVGGSVVSYSFFSKETWEGNSYADHNLNIASMDGVNYFKDIVEDRGTVSGLFGYKFKNTAIIGDAGIAFLETIHLGNTATPPQFAPGGYYYKSSSSTKFTYGVTIAHTVYNRIGIMLGYNNVQKVKVGLTYRITPTKLFNWL